MAEALDEGKVEVYLQGDKLDGPYALIRVATDEDDKPRWLMLKMKAQEESAEDDAS